MDNILRLGIDIGGTYVKFAILDNNGIVYKTSVATNVESPEKLADIIVSEALKIKETYNYKTVGVGTSGCIIDDLVYSDNLRFFGVPLKSMLEERFGFPVIIENDANCAALGELCFANQKGYKNIIYVTLGTGIGGGIIMNGKLCRNNGFIGEIGHMIVQNIGGIECSCGQRGCWEQYASATALIRMAKEKIDDSDDFLCGEYRKTSVLDGKVFFECLKNGSKIAQNVLNEYTDWLSIGIVSLINIFYPDVIILAGGITNEKEYILPLLKEKVHFDTPIEVSILQNDAGCMGASMLWENSNEN